MAAIPDPTPTRDHVRNLLERGEPFLALDYVSCLDEAVRKTPQIRRLEALALARCGASQEAAALLEGLMAEGVDDLETLGIRARTVKDLAWETANAEIRERRLAESQQHYQQAAERYRDHWTGVNAAFLALLLGRREDASRLAHRVLAWAGDGTTDPWSLASIGEAWLILGDAEKARPAYAAYARAMGTQRLGNLATTRRQARRVLDALSLPASLIDDLLPVPTMVVAAGYRPGASCRSEEPFSSSSVSAVRESVLRWLRDRGPAVVYASAAAGADILILEAAQELGFSTKVVLPFASERFVQTSVAVTGDTNWVARFSQVMSRADEVVIASKHHQVDVAVDYTYTNLLLVGSAMQMARHLDSQTHGLLVWDRLLSSYPGGTAVMSMVMHDCGISCSRLDPGSQAVSVPTEQQRPTGKLSYPVACILFADAAGFSKLDEAQLQAFFNDFLGSIGDMFAPGPGSPLFANSWGDAIHAVFRTVTEGGRFALTVAERLSRFDLAAAGLPKSLGLRIALHAGPTRACRDPVLGATTYIGQHVSFAARMEPITPPGQVYTSQAFAAMLACEPADDLVCTYIGKVTFAKAYGVFPTYRLHRRYADSPTD